MPPSTNHRPKTSRASTSSSRPSRASSTLSKTEIIINVYDLLPPGSLSSLLWPLGLSLVHTGIVLNNREYSYGAVPSPPSPTSPTNTGVFWTRPRLEPPGGTFRCSLLQGFTYLSPPEIDSLLKDISARFPGSSYDLLRNNCNHFTSHVCRVLTGREAPAWLNRAAKVGIMLPCLVPSEWVEPPDADIGEVIEDEEESGDERYGMLRRARVEDGEGRGLPASERAPRDRLIS